MSDNLSQPDDFEVWNFPQMAHAKQDSDSQQDEISLETQTHPEGQATSESSQEAMLLKSNLEQLSQMFQSLNTQLEQKIQEADGPLIEKIANLIKNTVKKIIDKELRHDPSILAQLIEKHLKDKKSPEKSTLILSSEGHELLQKNGLLDESFGVEIDPKLSLGDYRLITPNSELVVDIETILNTIFQFDHES